MVIILSAIASISTDIFESAEIDGANGFQKAVYITLPLIKNTMLVCITLCIAGNMKAFDNIYVMTKGGPGTASMVMAMYGYQVSFNQSNMGYGSCISVGIFVLSLTRYRRFSGAASSTPQEKRRRSKMAKTKSAGAHKAKKGLLGIFMNLILWIFSLSCIFPIVWMLYSSLKEKRAFNADIVGLPKSPTLINYTRILTEPGLSPSGIYVQQLPDDSVIDSADRCIQLYRRLHPRAGAL